MHRPKNESVGRWISLLHRYGHMFKHKKLKPLGISSGQLFFLVALHCEGEITQEELAKNMRMDKGTIARGIHKLEEQNFVIRETDKNNRRIKKIRLTEKAEKVMPQIYSILEEWTEVLTYDFSREEKEQALHILKRMASNAAQFVELDKKINS